MRCSASNLSLLEDLRFIIKKILQTSQKKFFKFFIVAFFKLYLDQYALHIYYRLLVEFINSRVEQIA